jgi:hypothetical protein
VNNDSKAKRNWSITWDCNVKNLRLKEPELKIERKDIVNKKIEIQRFKATINQSKSGLEKYKNMLTYS